MPSHSPRTPLTPPLPRLAAVDDAGSAQGNSPRSAQISGANSQDNQRSSAGLKLKGASWVWVYDNLAVENRGQTPDFPVYPDPAGAPG